MEVLIVFGLFGVLAAAIPMPSNEIKSEIQLQPEGQTQNTLSSSDANLQSDNTNADRSKRFLFFKLFHPYLFTYTKVYDTPVVTPIVRKTKVVHSAPVAYTYKVQPVTYRYTYTVPTFTIVKTAPIVKTVTVSSPAVKTVAVAGKIEPKVRLI